MMRTTLLSAIYATALRFDAQLGKGSNSGKLWGGWDVSLDRLMKQEVSLPRAASNLSIDSGRNLLLLGTFDSGTNLVEAMIQLNFGTKRHSWARHKYGEIWKHSLGKDGVYSLLQNLTGNKTWPKIALVAMVRTPLAQVESWQKAPYDLKSCADRPRKELMSSCSAPLSPRESCCGMHNGKCMYCDVPPTNFTSIVDVYNQYIQQYRAMISDGRFGAAVLLPYEQVVLDPKASMERVAKALAVSFTGENVLSICGPAKDHGDSGGREEALHSLQARDWLDSLNVEEINMLCRGLNMTLLKGLSEGSEGVHNIYSYAHDCLTSHL